jgi:hypothetical protein
MPSLTKSIVENAAPILPAATLTLPLPAGEEKREAIRRLNPAIPEEALHRGLLQFHPDIFT